MSDPKNILGVANMESNQLGRPEEPGPQQENAIGTGLRCSVRGE